MPQTVEITPQVLAWAIQEEGVDEGALAEGIGVETAELRQWLEGRSRPSKGQFSRLVQFLHRPRAMFFLPAAPQTTGVPPQLRSAPGLLDHELSPVERRLIRRARRLQREARWLIREHGDPPTTLPTLNRADPAESAGDTLRSWIGVTVPEQLSWDSPYRALKEWRRAIDELGVVVLQLQLGSAGVRGFSLSDEYVPLAAVNTAYNAGARVFTIFHELAHLAARADSVCASFYGPWTPSISLRLERWCEEVSASALLPRASLERVVREQLGSGREPVRTFDEARRLADKFKVSLRAMAIRLIRLQFAPQELNELIEEQAPIVDRPSGGGGGGGRVTAQRRLDEYGRRLPELFLDAAQAGTLPVRDALEMVGITTSQMDELRRLMDTTSS